MTKEDLRTGDIITTRKGDHYRVFLGGRCFCTNGDVVAKLDGEHWMSFSDYNDDLTSRLLSDYDIMKVEIGTYTSEFTEFHYDKICKRTVWERPEYYNGKVVCIESYPGHTTKGKIYEFKNGSITYDNGRKSMTYAKNLDEANNRFISKFIELVE